MMNPAIRQHTARALGVLSVIIFTVLVVDVLWGVATRYLLGSQATWSEELARLLLVWVSLLGAALAYAERSHLGVDALLIALDPFARRIAVLTSHLLVLLFAIGVMVYGGSVLFADRYQAGQMLSAIPILKAWVYLSVPVSGVLITIFAIDALATSWTGEPDALAPEPAAPVD
jgi:TRAP-type C4-dicarboxylate transport system permease small subunit